MNGWEVMATCAASWILLWFAHAIGHESGKKVGRLEAHSEGLAELLIGLNKFTAGVIAATPKDAVPPPPAPFRPRPVPPPEGV